MVITTIKTSKILTKRKKTTKNVERPKTPCLGKIPTQATAMLMTQVKYLTLTSTPKGSTIYEYPSHHESYAVPPPPPGHSFRPYTEKELPFPVPNEKCFYTSNSDLMSLYSILFQCISNGS
jgi:hypothetical protein